MQGSAVWIKDPDKNSTACFVKSTVKQFLPGRGYTVTMPDGKDKTLRPVDVAMANPDGMMQPVLDPPSTLTPVRVACRCRCRLRSTNGPALAPLVPPSLGVACPLALAPS